jgi:hypothetical protein
MQQHAATAPELRPRTFKTHLAIGQALCSWYLLFQLDQVAGYWQAKRYRRHRAARAQRDTVQRLITDAEAHGIAIFAEGTDGR